MIRGKQGGGGGGFGGGTILAGGGGGGGGWGFVGGNHFNVVCFSLPFLQHLCLEVPGVEYVSCVCTVYENTND